jgi:uncharacterized protein (TIGR02757 family)
MQLSESDLKDFLNKKADTYNNASFIDSDPIQVPHLFSKKQDIEIAAFLSASIAWGQRKSIVNNAIKMMELMDNSPHDFIVNFKKSEAKSLQTFVHRTFNADDFIAFLLSLQSIYTSYSSLEDCFIDGKTAFDKISSFRKQFVHTDFLKRTEKHISNPEKNSACKRLHMFLRWMVRKDKRGVDFGLWTNINPSQLMLPLDVHTANVGRKLGLLSRTQNDKAAVEEITARLRSFDKNDPVKYDFALFGLGVFEKF